MHRLIFEDHVHFRLLRTLLRLGQFMVVKAGSLTDAISLFLCTPAEA